MALLASQRSKHGTWPTRGFDDPAVKASCSWRHPFDIVTNETCYRQLSFPGAPADFAASGLQQEPGLRPGQLKRRLGMQYTCSVFIRTDSVAQVYDGLEVFAGCGSLTRCLRAAGLTVGMLEIRNWEPWQEQRAQHGLPLARGNPLDLLTAAGFAQLAGKHVAILHSCAIEPHSRS